MTDDTKNPGGWPAAPGVPANPERDGWHWLRYYNDAEPRLRLWDASGGTGWAFGPPHADPSVVTYLEPALTPAAVAAREAAARADGMREGAQVAIRFIGEWLHYGSDVEKAVEAAIEKKEPTT